MQFFFGDDSAQRKPTRDGMKPMIAAGGFLIDGNQVRNLEKELNAICDKFGFPAKTEFDPKFAEFKWSPGKELWMRANLIEDKRQNFFIEILGAAKKADVTAMVVMEDVTRRGAMRESKDNFEDCTRLLMERIEIAGSGDEGCVMIVDRPSGNTADDADFLGRCLEHIQSGSNYQKYEKFAINVVSSPSHLVRLLQLADVITSCTTAFVTGEAKYAPPIAKHIIPILYGSNIGGRIGGCGVKIYPEAYRNLYHWLFGDDAKWKGNWGHTLPQSGLPYAKSPDVYQW